MKKALLLPLNIEGTYTRPPMAGLPFVLTTQMHESTVFTTIHVSKVFSFKEDFVIVKTPQNKNILIKY